MKIHYFPQVKVVAATLPEEFEMKLNAALSELSGKKASLTFNLNAGHCAYIQYDEIQQIPETVIDEYHLRGELYSCCDCPHYKPSMDGRTKYSTCGFLGERTKGSSEACEWFYKRHAKGEIRPVERGWV